MIYLEHLYFNELRNDIGGMFYNERKTHLV